MARPPRFYVNTGKEAILDLLRQEHAATWAEVQAKVADRKWPSAATRVDPHHLTTARQELLTERRIAEAPGSFRTREVPLLHLADLSRRKTAFDRAAGRKRLLAARFLGWATGTPAHPQGLIGEAGERVFHASLVEAAPYGYALIRPEGGSVANVLGRPVPGGPLDSAAFLQVIGQDGFPASAILTAVEVKNVRHWIYPRSAELFQLLYKAARLQADNPSLPVLPLFVCRRRHYLTLQFSRALGFHTIETHRQFLLPEPSLAPHAVDEVREELAFEDLTVSTSADPDVVKVLREVVPRAAIENVRRWAGSGPSLVEHFEALRDPRVREDERSGLFDDLTTAMAELGYLVEW